MQMDDQNAPSLTHSNSIFQRLQFMFLKDSGRKVSNCEEVTVHNVAVKLRRVGTTQNSPCRRRNGLKNALSTLLMGVICTLPFFSDTKIMPSYCII